MKLKSNPSKQSTNYRIPFCKQLAFIALSSAAITASADVMLGASLPNDGFSRQVITDFNNVVPKNLAYVNVFSAFSHDWDNLYWQSTNVVAENAIPMISWMPIDLARPDDNLLPEIAAGLWDDYLTQWGTKLQAWVNSYTDTEKPRIAIRFAHEFNGNWYPYSNTPESYVAAWQHIHNTFQEMGINQHIDWVWSASKTNVDSYNDFTVYYPGDSYVDWTSLDGYNWGSNYSSGGWSSFKDIFNNAYITMVDNYPAKPIMIAETASAEPFDLPNTDYGMYGDNSDYMESKSTWIADMLFNLENDFPAIRALSLFNINKELNWSISTEINSGLDSWIAGTQSEYFTTDYLIVTNDTIDEPPEQDPVNEPRGKGRTKEKGKPNKRSTTERLVNSFDEQLISETQGSFADSNSRQIGADAQFKRAMSKKPEKIRNTSDRKLADTIRKLSAQERKKYVEQKLSVINY